MSELREAILREVRRQNLTMYQLAELVKGEVSQRTVYAFLTGEKDAKSKTVSAIMKALGLRIATTKGRGKKGPRGKE